MVYALNSRNNLAPKCTSRSKQDKAYRIRQGGKGKPVPSRRTPASVQTGAHARVSKVQVGLINIQLLGQVGVINCRLYINCPKGQVGVKTSERVGTGV